MASILDASLSSDSEDDVDYVPPQNEVISESSCEDNEDIYDDDNLKFKSHKARKTGQIDSQIEESNTKSETCKVSSACDEKKRTEDLWKSFLSDVSETETSKITSNSTIDNSEKIKIISNDTEEQKSEKASASKVFEFAGETHSVDKDNSAHDCITKQENLNEATSSQSPSNLPKKRSGLNSILGTIRNKKQKGTVLQESLNDWNYFKVKENIEEDLKTFNKGKQGFIERQRFLQRTDLRSFEIEKDMRQSLRKK
ncbi:hypothetical protein TNCT_157891 [Trichonephila clavata]|uniref:Craniofacial development protein 1 n=1 Tax=Trichonephila clavata TaxID=2740835 RepID=A0A8X6LX56_TRICU|nr:hypothetical protein TNCT_157891 [Trichonephila clavata]